MRRLLAFSLVTQALLAQSPSAPAAASKIAAELRAIETMKLQNPVEAFAKAKALLPATRPAFDRTSLPSAFASIREWNSHLDVYRAIYDTGVASGHFEEARESAVKAREMSMSLEKEAMASFNAYKATWEKAGDESLKVLAEMKALEAEVESARATKATPPKPTPKQSLEEANAELVRQAEAARQLAEASQRLAFLKANEATFRDNVEKAKNVMTPLERPIKDLASRTRVFESAVAQWDKYLKEESEDIASKYKGSKASYAAGLLRGVAPKPQNKEAALVALHRAAFLDPKNAALQKRIAQLQGKTPASTNGKGRKG